MTSKMGVWIDHRKAILVTVSAEGEEVMEIDSEVEKHVRESGGSRSGGLNGAQDTTAGDRIDRKFANHLNTYYDDVIKHLQSADEVVIFGPGEAKGELDKRITNKDFRKKIHPLQTIDKLTTPQLKAKVREYFQPSGCSS